MAETPSVQMLRPFGFGRSSRVVFGLAVFIVAFVFGTGPFGLGGLVALLCIGLSFVVGGLMGTPGCVLSAPLNLLLPRGKRLHFRCLIWTPLDKAEQALRQQRGGG